MVKTINLFFKKIKKLDVKILIKLMTSGLIAGLIPLLFEPYFKSIYSPQDFGKYDVFLKILAIMVPVLTLKSEIIILSTDIASSFQKWFNSLCIIIINSLLFLFFLLLVNFFFEIEILRTLMLSLIGAFEFSVILISVNTLIKMNKSTLVSFQKPIRRVSELIVLSIISIFLVNSFSIIISSLIGLLFAMIFSVKSLLMSVSGYKLKFGLRTLINSAKETKNILLSEVINTVSFSFLSVFIYYNYSATESGLMELSNKIVSIPQVLFCGFIAIIIQNKLSNIVNENKSIITFVKDYIYLLTFISLMSCIIIFFVTGYAIQSLFTEDWWGSISFVNILLIQLLIFIVFSPLSRVLYSLKAYKSYRNWQIIKSLLIISTMVFYELSLYSFLLTYSITTALAYLLLIIFLVKEIKIYESSILKI